jgi:hypothetical protein
MKEQILAKIKSIILNNSEQVELPDKSIELRMNADDLDHATEEIDTILSFFEAETQARSLEKIVKKAEDNFDYVKDVVEDVKKADDIVEVKKERRKNELDEITEEKED